MRGVKKSGQETLLN